MHGIKYVDLSSDPNTRDEQVTVAARVLHTAIRQGWTVADTADVLAMLGLEHVAVELGWRP